VAIPAFGPEEASARNTSEAQARQTCEQLGGTFEVEVMDPAVPSANQYTCTQLLWDLFTCHPNGYIVIPANMRCGY
jgi:hypothetical protein